MLPWICDFQAHWKRLAETLQTDHLVLSGCLQMFNSITLPLKTPTQMYLKSELAYEPCVRARYCWYPLDTWLQIALFYEKLLLLAWGRDDKKASIQIRMLSIDDENRNIAFFFCRKHEPQC